MVFFFFLVKEYFINETRPKEQNKDYGQPTKELQSAASPLTSAPFPGLSLLLHKKLNLANEWAAWFEVLGI